MQVSWQIGCVNGKSVGWGGRVFTAALGFTEGLGQYTFFLSSARRLLELLSHVHLTTANCRSVWQVWRAEVIQQRGLLNTSPDNWFAGKVSSVHFPYSFVFVTLSESSCQVSVMPSWWEETVAVELCHPGSATSLPPSSPPCFPLFFYVFLSTWCWKLPQTSVLSPRQILCYE